MDDIKPTQQEVNVFLDVVRSSGVTNMFGAAPYIQKHFKTSKAESTAFLMEWMKTFKERREEGEVLE